MGENLNKDKFVYRMMIRQPDFLDNKLFENILEMLANKVGPEMIKGLKLETIREGQMCSDDAYWAI